MIDDQFMKHKTVFVDGVPRVMAYTEAEAPGAYPNGSRVRKAKLTDPVERTPKGTLGTVIGSMKLPEQAREEMTAIMPHLASAKYMYWIAWETEPDIYIACIDTKLEAA